MGKVKSIRFNEQTERMFNVIKEYYSIRGGKTDSEIITAGIKAQYNAVVEDLNKYFKEQINEGIAADKEVMEVFERICDILEVLSAAKGTTLEYEFDYYMEVCHNESCHVLEGLEVKERHDVTEQYRLIFEKIAKMFGKDIMNDEMERVTNVLYGQFKKIRK